MKTDGPRGTFSRVRSRTSGFSVNAITLAVRKRKRTWPSVLASRNARTSATGRTTSWIHRGIWIVGPGPAMRGSYRGAWKAPGGELATVRAMATPRSRHAARLRADRRRAQARARRIAVAAVIGVLAVVTLALTAFDNPSGGTAAVSKPAPLPVTSAPPDPHVLATVGNLRVQSPVAEGGVTAIGFHGTDDDGALVLKPVGPQVNE